MMIEKILLNSIDKVKEFCRRVQNIDADMYLEEGCYVIDAKSIMGIYSLNLIKPITLKVETENKEIIKTIKEVVKPYIV